MQTSQGATRDGSIQPLNSLQQFIDQQGNSIYRQSTFSRTPRWLGAFGAAVAAAGSLGVLPGLAGALTVTSSFSITPPAGLSGTSGAAITPVQFTTSGVDASTSPATTSIAWTAEQLPAGLSLSSTGLLSGTLSAAIPAGTYDVRISATEKVTTTIRSQISVNYVTSEFASAMPIAGTLAFTVNPTTLGSGFSGPTAVALDNAGHVLVADTEHNRVVEMNTDGSGVTTRGTGFSKPEGVAVDASGHIFVADTDNSRIVRMNADGTDQTTISTNVEYPCGLAIDASGHLFVADTLNNRIVRMNADGTDQTTIASGFNGPQGVAVDAAGNIYVADTSNNRIVKMNADGTGQTTIASPLNYPVDVVVDSAGHVFVANSVPNQILEMNADGSDRVTFSLATSNLVSPNGLAVDSAGHVYVAVYGSSKVVVLNPGFYIADTSIPSVSAGHAVTATHLSAAALDSSTSPKVTSVKWTATDLLAGLKLSSGGVLSGTPVATLAPGTYSLFVTATEKVTTKVGSMVSVKYRTTGRSVPITIS